MIDGDDRHDDNLRDADERDGQDHEGERSSNEESDGETMVAERESDQEPDADSPTEEAAAEDTSGDASPPEERPAMELESGSDEGGTVEDAPSDPEAPAEPESTMEFEEVVEPEEPTEPETLAEAGAFEGADLDEGEEEPVFDDDDLGLVSDDDALPWLESSDYDEVESVDAWRVTGFVVLGLLALALLIGGIWYFNNRNGEGLPVADGSVIEAPEGPYKERPENPGGKTFEGTGDMAPAVGEGETREGRLAEKSATPEPVAKPTEKAAETPAAPAAKDNRIAVQVGAYRDTATAEAGWKAINRQTDALAGVEYRIVKGEADIGTVYRLQALPGDMAAARALSDALKADGVASQIKQ